MTTRRDFLRSAALASAASIAVPTAAAAAAASAAAAPVAGLARHLPADLPLPPTGPLDLVAQDEAYWRAVATQYAVTDQVTNMEAGFFGMMPTPVLAAYHRNIDRVNRESSFFARRGYPALAEASRARVAQALGIAPGELAFSRNATEALQTLIGQYNRVNSGDTVMYADLDYPAMQLAMNALAARRGATVATLDIPEPATLDGILAAYTAAFDAHPRTRLLLLTHANNKTGLLHPARAIPACCIRRARSPTSRAHEGSTPSSMRRIRSGRCRSRCPTSARRSSGSTCTSGLGHRSASVRSTSVQTVSRRSTVPMATTARSSGSTAASTPGPPTSPR